MIIVIDGPAGSGKSSTAKAVARRTSFRYLDSGAFYRALAWMYHTLGCKNDVFFERLTNAELGCIPEEDRFRVFLNGTELTDHLRTPTVNNLVSTVAALPGARAFVNAYMRSLVQESDFIADGRDLGTVVFPDAALKFFLVADIKTRAARRVKEMVDAGLEPDPDSVEQNLLDRDQTDSTRAIAPLTKAGDAIEIDTSKRSFNEQVDIIIGHINQLKSRS